MAVCSLSQLPVMMQDYWQARVLCWKCSDAPKARWGYLGPARSVVGITIAVSVLAFCSSLLRSVNDCSAGLVNSVVALPRVSCITDVLPRGHRVLTAYYKRSGSLQVPCCSNHTSNHPIGAHPAFSRCSTVLLLQKLTQSLPCVCLQA